MMKQELQDFIIELYKRQFTMTQIKVIVEQKGAKNYSFQQILNVIENSSQGKKKANGGEVIE